MKFFKKNSELFVPYGGDGVAALKKATHLAVAAHQDDAEIIGFEGIAKSYLSKDKSFAAVIVTDGAGSARTGRYAAFTDDDMKNIRRLEQKNAAHAGSYGALALLDYTSAEVKNPADTNVGADLDKIFGACAPEVVYTHSPADKHDTHIGVVVKTLDALRRLPKNRLPKKLYGCEVWRDLDWVCDGDKAVMDVTGYDSLSACLLGAFDSQIAGGKRYDLAVEGRRRANATFFASHSADNADRLIFALDMTPLLSGGDIVDFALGHIDKFKRDVETRLRKIIG